jgi:hypothetical protein
MFTSLSDLASKYSREKATTRDGARGKKRDEKM